MTNSYKLFIGADEAGYGPNLGPLIVAGTVWRVPASLSERAFGEALSSTFGPRPLPTDLSRIPLGDSKRLYKPKSSLKNLEAGLWALLPSAECGEFEAFVNRFVEIHGDLLPWYDTAQSQKCPIAITPVQALELCERASQCLEQQDIRMLGVRAVAITEQQFNNEVERSGSKGQLLSDTTLRLVSQLQSEHQGDGDLLSNMPCEIFCDRQGGRRNYLPVLQAAMPDSWFQPQAVATEEGAEPSHRPTDRISYYDAASRTRIHFTIGGDSFPPAGLASMLAKYVREQFMLGYNEFWSKQVSGLKPTAGYPQDARRFRDEVASEVARLGVAATDWWRCK
ncbi:MAG: hypothetical protein AAGG44_16655 [Planctomycetota bacterium]